MRIPCPLCGPRDRREFYYYGSDDYLDRPAEAAGPEAWDDYLHLRDNPAGPTRDLWYHDLGCSAWIAVERDTVSHEILSARLLDQGSATAEAKAPGGGQPRKKGRGAAE